MLAELDIRRGDFSLLLELAVRPGEVVALLGPNGAGKSTALRALAGLVPVSRGRVTIGGQAVEDTASGRRLPPHRRSVGVVFQDYLLFPHLSVVDNVAFGPRTQGMRKDAARAMAQEWLRRVGAADIALARARQISGGQAQRVALARALATRPQLLLLDEPLAALDARTRLGIRGELRRHLSTFEGAAVLVTHDPIDAAVLADRLVVVEDGRVVQQGTPSEVARRPRTDYVARLVGLNLLLGQSSGHRVTLPDGGSITTSTALDGDAFTAFRPAAVSLFTSRPDGSPRNLWQGRIVGLEPHGEGVRVELTGTPDAGSSLLAEVTQAAVADLDLLPGKEVWASVKASDVESYPLSHG
nr:ABC transporter ATP-binding protein [Microlunatus panaciterrae]